MKDRYKYVGWFLLTLTIGCDGGRKVVGAAAQQCEARGSGWTYVMSTSGIGYSYESEHWRCVRVDSVAAVKVAP